MQRYYAGRRAVVEELWADRILEAENLDLVIKEIEERVGAR